MDENGTRLGKMTEINLAFMLLQEGSAPQQSKIRLFSTAMSVIFEISSSSSSITFC